MPSRPIPEWWEFRSVLASDNFKLASLEIESGSCGYDDTGLVVSALVDLTASGTDGAITYVKLGAAVGGTLTFGAGWGNIDTVRFSSTAGDPYGTQLWIDNIDVSAPEVAADTTPPTAILGLSDSALKLGDTALATITFSEAVTGFTNADLTVANGTLGALSSSDGGVTWTATFTPTAGVADATNVITLDQTGIADAAGNAGFGAASSANYVIDTAPPTAAIVLSDSALIAGESATVTITFTEAVTGLTLADLGAGAGVLSGLASLDGGVTWRATFAPGVGITAAANTITLDNSGVTNGAGNAGSGATSSANYAVDTARPSATIALSDRTLTMGETATVTITFSEAVVGLTNADLVVEHGTLGVPASSDGGVTWRTILTPDAATRADGVIRLAASGVADLAGNTGDTGNTGGTGNTQVLSEVYSIDTRVFIDQHDVNIDGAPGTSVTVIDPVSGLAMVTLTVPVTLAFDPPPILGKPGVADIALGVAPTDLVVRLPVSAGLVAEGPATLLAVAQATMDLMRRIDSVNDAGSSERQEIRTQAHGFLDGLAGGAPTSSRNWPSARNIGRCWPAPATT